MDFDANYTFGFDNIGDFRIGLQATYVQEFLVQSDPESPPRDVAGKYNWGTGAAPELPPWEGQYAHELDQRQPLRGFHGPLHRRPALRRTVLLAHGFLQRVYRPGGIFETGIYAWTDMDLAYTYRGLELFDARWP